MAGWGAPAPVGVSWTIARRRAHGGDLAVIVRCISNRQETLPPDLVEGLPEGTVVFFPEDLTVGQEYVVYAMLIRGDQTWFYLCANRGVDIPYRYPSQVFEVVDSRLSHSWRFSHQQGRSGGGFSLFAVPEWVEDRGFYERLVDGLDPERAVFRRYRLLIEAEAAPAP
jgi:hypothetical protein